LQQQSWVILPVDSLALWKIINEEDSFLIPKKSKARILSADFCTRKFWGRGEVSRYAATIMIATLSPCHNDKVSSMVTNRDRK
jgi:hypothetical protein